MISILSLSYRSLTRSCNSDLWPSWGPSEEIRFEQGVILNMLPIMVLVHRNLFSMQLGWIYPSYAQHYRSFREVDSHTNENRRYWVHLYMGFWWSFSTSQHDVRRLPLHQGCDDTSVWWYWYIQGDSFVQEQTSKYCSGWVCKRLWSCFSFQGKNRSNHSALDRVCDGASWWAYDPVFHLKVR